MANFNTLAEVQTSTSGDFYHLQQGGIDYKQTRETLAGAIANARWSSTFTYNIGSRVTGSDGELYVALTQNTGQDPTTDDGTNWGISGLSEIYTENLTRYSAPQNWNVEGTTGDPLVSTTPTAYIIGAEFALNCEVTVDISDLEKDINGVLRASDGAFRIYKNQDPNQTTLFGMITDGSGNLYNAAETNGLTVGVDSGRDYIEVDWALYNAVTGTDGIYIAGHTAQVGRIPPVSDEDSSQLATKKIGVDQTWQDVSSSRTFDVTYTNSTGRPIQIAIAVGGTASTGSGTFTLDSVSYTYNSEVGVAINLIFIIPSNSTYMLGTPSGSGQFIASWIELR